MVMLATSQYYQIERDLVTGLVILASLVLLRSMSTRRRRLSVISQPLYSDLGEDDVLEDGEIVALGPESNIGRATSGHR